ncbi:hypothetical protein Barb7_01901 [Bacteroidales bacterium Barb7]|nr:hypothetical protein Barb7_01901 [Bacteroidales bacterium Barb7]
MQVRDSLFKLPVADEVFGVDGGVLVQVLSGDAVDIQLPQDVFGFVEPFHLRVAAGLPEAGLGGDFRILHIMAGDVGEGGGGLQEIAVEELRLSEHQPAVFQEGIVFFLRLKGRLFGIVAPARFLGRLCLYGMQFDGFVAFLQGTVEGSAGAGFFFGKGINGVHEYHARIVLLIPRFHRL